MELTPQDRQRIYEEEKARLEREADQPPPPPVTLPPISHAPPPGTASATPKWAALAVIVLFIFVGLFALMSFLKSPDPRPSPDAANVFQPSAGPSPNVFKPPTPIEHPPAPEPGADRADIGNRSELAIMNNVAAVNKSVTYEHLKKNADRYSGEAWAFTGTVMQINEQGNQTTGLVSLDAWGNKLIWVAADFPTEFVERDKVYVVGHIAGNYSYKSIAGWDMTVPAVAARAIMKPAEAAKFKPQRRAK